MKKDYKENPLYRFFNVILVICYLISAFITYFIGEEMFRSRSVISASVQCKDGTSWDATKIVNNYDALCGICTKRSADGKTYDYCSDQTYYNSSPKLINEKYNNTPVINGALIAFFVTFGIVDFIGIAMAYIFSGKVIFTKSLILKTISFFFSRKSEK